MSDDKSKSKAKAKSDPAPEPKAAPQPEPVPEQPKLKRIDALPGVYFMQGESGDALLIAEDGGMAVKVPIAISELPLLVDGIRALVKGAKQ